MRYPTLAVRKPERQVVSRFLGLNRNPGILRGEFPDMENLSSDAFPALSPRRRRGTWAKPASPQGLLARDVLCYVDGAELVLGQTRCPLGLSTDPADCPKTLVSMGAWVIVLPDKKYVNSANTAEYGSIENTVTVTGVEFTLCREDGAAYTGAQPGEVAPETAENGALWLDTSGEKAALKQYSAAQGSWVTIPTTYVKLSAPGIGAGFSAMDGVNIRDCRDPAFNASHLLLHAEHDAVVLEGMLEQSFTQDTPVTLERRMPRMDHVVEAGNRLWGCRYGPDEKGIVRNEIYASKLGDFRNWECFAGLSTDSFAASCGTEGPFTGAANHLGYPIFFKEHCLHKVYGTQPSSFRIQTVLCRGVEPGCGKSLAQVGQLLVYKAREGFCAYDGAAPELISRPLGTVRYSRAVACALGDKYYVSACDSAGESHLLVWDSARNLWHREDGLACMDLCALAGEVYAIDSRSRNILALLGSGEPESQVSWMAQTGPWGLELPEQKYISRLLLRLELDPDARVTVEVCYNGEQSWETLCVLFGMPLGSASVPLRLRRCDYFALRIRGTGGAKIYSITNTLERGSDSL